MQLPITYRRDLRNLLRAVSGPGTLASTALAQEFLCPKETEELRPPILLKGHIDKICGAPPESTIKDEIKFALRRDVIHDPTIAYHIKQSALIDGSIYSKNLRHFVLDKSVVLGRAQTVCHFEKIALVSTLVGNKYFAHWIKDECTQHLLAEMYGGPLILRAPPYKDAVKYAQYFGQDWESFAVRAIVDDLVIFHDHSQNSLKRRRYRTLRERVKQRVACPETPSPLVYLRRGTTGASRLISNEAEIVKALIKRDFVIVDVSASDLETILSPLLTAKLVISMEGSHCGHCVTTMQEGSGLIVLAPPDRFTVNQRGWADCLSIRTGFIVGDRVESGSHFSIEDIARMIDLMMKEIN
jgi:Glycosyltransferase 61